MIEFDGERTDPKDPKYKTKPEVLIHISQALDSFWKTELAAEMYVDDVLDKHGEVCYLDSMVRMTALPEPEHLWVHEVIERQERSFHNGS